MSFDVDIFDDHNRNALGMLCETDLYGFQVKNTDFNLKIAGLSHLATEFSDPAQHAALQSAGDGEAIQRPDSYTADNNGQTTPF